MNSILNFFHRLNKYLLKNLLKGFDYFYLKIFNVFRKSSTYSYEFYENGFIFFPANVFSIANRIREDAIKLEEEGKVVSKSSLFKNYQNTLSHSIFSNTLFYEVPDKVFRDYLYIDDPLKNLPYLGDFLKKEIVPFAEQLIGGNISIENVQIYKTSPSIDQLENEKFHYDSIDLDESFKIMFYLTDCNLEHGPLELQSKNTNIIWTGNVGSGIAFRAKSILHRGNRPTLGDRWVLNLKIYPKITSSAIQYKGSETFNAIRRLFLFCNMR